jgi:rfaE bifunctional protein nucleotidyltransferase chain/domain/rfaE bifunctional protein kinase chain/domain
MAESIVVVGDALLDRDVDGRVDRLAPDAPVPVVHDAVTHSRAGGAALAARLAAQHGADVTLVTALGDDDAGRELAALVTDADVELVDIGRAGPTPVKTRVRVDGHPLLRLDEGDDDPHVLDGPVARVVDDGADAYLVADYGLGVAAHPELRARLRRGARRQPVVWDPHPRGAPPIPGARLVTPNQREVERLGHAVGSIREVTDAALALCARWEAHGVVVTRGAHGAILGIPGRLPLAVPAPCTSDRDPCGAGDCFAAAAAVGLGRGMVLSEAVQDGVAQASRFVAAGGVAALAAEAARPAPGVAAADRVADVRRRGGRVIATSGCFDLLHVGHLAMLQSARALGDALVVLLNSDRSVQDLKGAQRPIVPQHDRAAVLRGLECVDAVEVFDELTPVAALRRLQPDVFVKGDDYGAGTIPESTVVREWDGTVVVVPYVEGRSTTRLIQEANREE